MKAQEKDRIECAIRHIQTAVDVDPWAKEIAVEAMRKQIDTDGDCISRQETFNALRTCFDTESYYDEGNGGYFIKYEDAVGAVEELPSAQPEIVRCKDCNNYDTDWTPETVPDRHYCFVMDSMMPKDGFCNYAERRTDEGD